VVIAPPVRTALEIERSLTPDEFALLNARQEPFFLCAGALVPYKRIDVAIAACNSIGAPLWVIGKGPELDALKAQAGPTVKFFGHVSEAFLWECYRRCRALLFPGIEDFGIVPVECLASGRPVIAIQAGGVAETVQGVPVGTPQEALPAHATGVFMPKSSFGSPAALAKAIRYFATVEGAFQAQDMRENAQQFESASFFRTWRRFADRVKIPKGVLPAGVSAEACETDVCRAEVSVGER
jgi:glycosyltransferase involved in cell wall biosynthesis